MSSHANTPGYSEGWFNGNPYQMIEAGTYDTFRDRMEGLKYTPEQIEAFDALNEETKKLRAKKKLPAEGTEAAALLKEKESKEAAEKKSVKSPSKKAKKEKKVTAPTL